MNAGRSSKDNTYDKSFGKTVRLHLTFVGPAFYWGGKKHVGDLRTINIHECLSFVMFGQVKMSKTHLRSIDIILIDI